MKLQRRSRKKANRKRRNLGGRRQSYTLKKCTAIKAGSTFTYLRMLVLIYSHLCHLKNVIHVSSGHTKGVSVVRLFLRSRHLLLSCSMNCKIKLWEVYGDQHCLRTFIDHSTSVRDICFNSAGTQFLSAACDWYLKLWNTQTGRCISRLTKSTLLCQVLSWPTKTSKISLWLGCPTKRLCSEPLEVERLFRNTICIWELSTRLSLWMRINRRFANTSDNERLRVWEWDNPVDFKSIAELSMHSMPVVTLSPNGKWLACQSWFLEHRTDSD